MHTYIVRPNSIIGVVIYLILLAFFVQESRGIHLLPNWKFMSSKAITRGLAFFCFLSFLHELTSAMMGLTTDLQLCIVSSVIMTVVHIFSLVVLYHVMFLKALIGMKFGVASEVNLKAIKIVRVLIYYVTPVILMVFILSTTGEILEDTVLDYKVCVVDISPVALWVTLVADSLISILLLWLFLVPIIRSFNAAAVSSGSQGHNSEKSDSDYDIVRNNDLIPSPEHDNPESSDNKEITPISRAPVRISGSRASTTTVPDRSVHSVGIVYTTKADLQMLKRNFGGFFIMVLSTALALSFTVQLTDHPSIEGRAVLSVLCSADLVFNLFGVMYAFQKSWIRRMNSVGTRK